MATPARRRLAHDYKKLQEDPPGSGIMATPDETNVMKWEAVIFGQL